MRCNEIHAGMLKEKVTFQRATLTGDGKGGQTSSWATITGAPTWAHVEPLSGAEATEGERIAATSKFRALVRYASGLLESDRVLIRGEAHNIRSILDLEMQRRWLVIETEQGVAA